MKRRIMVLIMLVFLLVQAYSFSVHPYVHDEQPFDSEQELSKMDFSKPLAQNQLDWINTCTISLVTIGPGDQLYAWFGHSAIIVSQPNGQRVMYDYGIFDTSQKHFYLHFAQGRMLYSVFASNADWRIDDAISEERDAKEIELNLTPEAKFTMIRFLQNNAKPENNTYLYHFYKDNCATRLRDIINAATGGQFRTWAENKEAGGTYRSLTERSMAHSPVISWLLNFLQGPSIDYPLNHYEEMFLPESLFQGVQDFTYADGTPLAKKIMILNDTNGKNIRFIPYTKNVNYDAAFGFAGLILGLLSLFLLKHGEKHLLSRRLWALFNGTILLFLSVIGTLLLFMMTLSNMDMTWFNENIVFINPFLFIGCFKAFSLFFKQEKSTGSLLHTYKIFSVLTVILVVAKGLYPTQLIQDNLNIILFLLPMYLVGFAEKNPKFSSRK
ncbi:DUF4105 domain-containing protein [uncultured Sphaerochaeta sp.]|uniref:Lnb N-terminal periplasmic domain-containing protein n=1 Tax=uncultured Sphaerochaeta sp. TaxID=886478 RepID=UPI002A0A3FA9|nr:DUF4105 domain-containing protein [uncultured Sphaerochaeta sp.]